MRLPTLQPIMAWIGTPSSPSRARTPMWAGPRKPPDPRTRAMRPARTAPGVVVPIIPPRPSVTAWDHTPSGPYEPDRNEPLPPQAASVDAGLFAPDPERQEGPHRAFPGPVEELRQVRDPALDPRERTPHGARSKHQIPDLLAMFGEQLTDTAVIEGPLPPGEVPSPDVRTR